MKHPPQSGLPPVSGNWRRWVEDGIRGLHRSLNTLSSSLTASQKTLQGTLRVLGNQIQRLDESITHTEITYTASGGLPLNTELEISEIVKPSWGWSNALIFASIIEYEVPSLSASPSSFTLSQSPNINSTNFLVAEYTPVTASTRTNAVIPFNVSDFPLSVALSPPGTEDVTVTIRLTAIWS